MRRVLRQFLECFRCRLVVYLYYLVSGFPPGRPPGRPVSQVVCHSQSVDRGDAAVSVASRNLAVIRLRPRRHSSFITGVCRPGCRKQTHKFVSRRGVLIESNVGMASGCLRLLLVRPVRGRFIVVFIASSARSGAAKSASCFSNYCDVVRVDNSPRSRKHVAGCCCSRGLIEVQ